MYKYIFYMEFIFLMFCKHIAIKMLCFHVFGKELFLVNCTYWTVILISKI